MGLLKDWINDTNGYRFTYRVKQLFSPSVWFGLRKSRKQRANRGWSDRDTWGGGEYLAGVAAGVLKYLEREQNPIDWEHYFRENYPHNYGYKSLTEVAEDIELYLWWQENQWGDEYDTTPNDHRWSIDNQLYSQLQNAMHFLAENIGHLWW